MLSKLCENVSDAFRHVAEPVYSVDGLTLVRRYDIGGQENQATICTYPAAALKCRAGEALRAVWVCKPSEVVVHTFRLRAADTTVAGRKESVENVQEPLSVPSAVDDFW